MKCLKVASVVEADLVVPLEVLEVSEAVDLAVTVVATPAETAHCDVLPANRNAGKSSGKSLAASLTVCLSSRVGELHIRPAT